MIESAKIPEGTVTLPASTVSLVSELFPTDAQVFLCTFSDSVTVIDALGHPQVNEQLFTFTASNLRVTLIGPKYIFTHSHFYPKKTPQQSVSICPSKHMI